MATKTAKRSMWVVMAVTILMATTATSGAQPGDTTAAGGALSPAFEALFGPVSVTGTEGGPAQGGWTPGEAATFSGTRDGDKAVLYRRSAEDTNCAEPPTPLTCNETWLWDGTDESWTQLPTSAPKSRQGQSSGAMPEGAEGQAWIYSGGYPDVGNPAPWDEADMYILGDDLQWTAAPCSPTCAPGPRDGGMGAASSTDTLLLGGEYSGAPPWPATDFDSGGYSNQVWRWNGTDWDLLPVQGTPPTPRAAGAFGFDGQDYILFGGAREDVVGEVVTFTTFDDTWRLSEDDSGTWSWSQVCESCAPPHRFQANLAGLYRPGSPTPGAVVAGGYQFTQGEVSHDGEMNALSDVWMWDGSTWTAADPGIAPCSYAGGGPPPYPACLTDPAIPFTPFMASMPAVGAAAWTAGSCTTMEQLPGQQGPQQVCRRATTQVSLVDPAPPSTTTTTTTATAAPSATPRFTG